MIVIHLLLLQEKSFFRNSRWRRNWFSGIIFGILALYFLLLAFVLGKHIDVIIGELGVNPINTFNYITVWYLLADLLLRSFLQNIPSVQIIPFLRLNIRHFTIINLLLFRSLWNIFNLVPLFIVIPFTLKILLPSIGIWHSMFYFISFLLLILINNYLAVLIYYLSKINAGFLTIPFLFAAFFMGLQKTNFPIHDLSVSLGKFMIQDNLANFLLLLLVLGGTYALIYKILVNNTYIDTFNTKNGATASNQWVWLDEFSKFGEIGTYITLELKLLIRNKRPRQALMMIPIMVIYIIIFNLNYAKDNFLALILPCVLGVGTASYGQYLFSWESSYFDGIMARKNNLVNYIKAKYYLMSAVTIIIFIPFFIYFSITGKENVILLSVFLIFTVGVLCLIMIFIGTFNDGRIDLTQNNYFNFQGKKANQYLLTSVLMILPVGMYSLFSFLINDTIGKLVIGLMGLLFIITHEWWLKKIIVPYFISRKYKNLEGYRKFSV